MNALEKLRQIVTEIRDEAPKTDENWALAPRLLRGLPVDRERSAEICERRDIEALDGLVAKLEGILERQQAPAGEVSEEEMASALKAFKKRLKLGRLADESKLGGRYTSGGHRSGRDAIIPPDGFKPDVWKALERSGKLRNMGDGFYSEA